MTYQTKLKPCYTNLKYLKDLSNDCNPLWVFAINQNVDLFVYVSEYVALDGKSYYKIKLNQWYDDAISYTHIPKLNAHGIILEIKSIALFKEIVESIISMMIDDCKTYDEAMERFIFIKKIRENKTN